VYVPDNTGLLIAALTGGITSLVVVLVLLIALVFICWRKSKLRRQQEMALLNLQNDDTARSVNSSDARGMADLGTEVYAAANSNRTVDSGENRSTEENPVMFVRGPRMNMFNLRGIPNRASLTKRFRYSANPTSEGMLGIPHAHISTKDGRDQDHEVDYSQEGSGNANDQKSYAKDFSKFQMVTIQKDYARNFNTFENGEVE